MAVHKPERGSKGCKRRFNALRTSKRRRSNRLLDERHKASAGLASEWFAFGREKRAARNMTASAAGTAEDLGKNVKQKGGLKRGVLDTGTGARHGVYQLQGGEIWWLVR